MPTDGSNDITKQVHLVEFILQNDFKKKWFMSVAMKKAVAWLKRLTYVLFTEYEPVF